MEVAKLSFHSPGGLGVSQGPHENMVGDSPRSKKVGCPTKPTNLDLHSANRILLYP